MSRAILHLHRHHPTRTGEELSAPYHRLIMATGSNAFILPIPGSKLEGVLGYRDIADTQAMIDAATQYQHAVVIGGGLLGLEAANGLMKRGMQVTVVHVGDWLMERQLDAVAGKLLRKSLQERGMQFQTRSSSVAAARKPSICVLRASKSISSTASPPAWPA